MTYEYAILSLVKLESQKKQINKISTINNNICEHISISSQILSSFNSFFKNIKFKMNYYPISDPLETGPTETRREPTLSSILDINKKMNKELEEQNNNLKNLGSVIQTNNYKLKKTITVLDLC